MEPIVSGDELAGLVDAGTVVVADVRWYLDDRSGRDAYEAGHVPGAVFVDLDTVLAGPPGSGPGRHPLPTPEDFAAAMGALGIGDDSTVVAYDDAGGSVAARLWWMLQVTGHRVAVLDGGLAAWPRDLEAGPGPDRAARAATFTASPWPVSRLADAALTGALAAGGGAVVDARAAERYRGEVEPIDPRAGHIPGAKSAPWSANLDPTTGRFLLAGPLRDHYRSLGVEHGESIVAYCGSGVTSCHAILALEIAGLGESVRLYEGSWSDWSSDAARPVATGEAPG